jgi:hypothetical protein
VSCAAILAGLNVLMFAVRPWATVSSSVEVPNRRSHVIKMLPVAVEVLTVGAVMPRWWGAVLKTASNGPRF